MKCNCFERSSSLNTRLNMIWMANSLFKRISTRCNKCNNKLTIHFMNKWTTFVAFSHHNTSILNSSHTRAYHLNFKCVASDGTNTICYKNHIDSDVNHWKPVLNAHYRFIFPLHMNVMVFVNIQARYWFQTDRAILWITSLLPGTRDLARFNRCIHSHIFVYIRLWYLNNRHFIVSEMIRLPWDRIWNWNSFIYHIACIFVHLIVLNYIRMVKIVLLLRTNERKRGKKLHRTEFLMWISFIRTKWVSLR